MIRRTKSAKSLSAVNGHHGAGRGKLDYKGCKTEDDFQKRNEEFWAPPELGMLNKTSRFNLLRTPEESEASSDEEGGKEDYLRRRRSHEIMSPRTPQSMSPAQLPSPSPSFARQSSTDRPPRTPDSLAGNRSPGAVDDGDITKRLEGLLVTPEEDQEQGSRLVVSRFQRIRLAKQAKEREAREKSAALRAAKERRLHRRNPLRPLVQSLNSRWEEKVRSVEYECSPTNLRPLATAIKGLEISGKDFATLLGRRSWLNDEIINAYLEWIEDAANKAAAAEAKACGERVSDVPKFIAHNSFFYESLVNKGPNSMERLMKRKKAAGKSFMQVDSMFVPICKGSHWTVGVVRPIAKTIEYFDSMGGNGEPFIRLMRSWLKAQLGDAYIEDEWKVPRTSCAVQNNGYDCGVFVCTNSFCVAIGLDTSCYTELDMTQQRRNIAAILLNRGFVGDFEWGNNGV
jgi:sentrin-specific protease 1